MMEKIPVGCGTPFIDHLGRADQPDMAGLRWSVSGSILAHLEITFSLSIDSALLTFDRQNTTASARRSSPGLDLVLISYSLHQLSLIAVVVAAHRISVGRPRCCYQSSFFGILICSIQIVVTFGLRGVR